MIGTHDRSALVKKRAIYKQDLEGLRIEFVNIRKICEIQTLDRQFLVSKLLP